MTFVDKLAAHIEQLSLDAIGSAEKNLVLKAVARIGYFSDGQFVLFAKGYEGEKLVLVHQLRAQAKAALSAVAGGQTALDATDIARKAKEQLLIQEVCPPNHAHIVEDMAIDDQIDLLSRAKKIVPFCEREYARVLVIKMIKKHREVALDGLEELLVLCRNKFAHEKFLDLIGRIIKKGASLQEWIPLLKRLPVTIWEAILTAHIEKGYSATVVQNGIPLYPFCCKDHSIKTVCECVAAVGEQEQPAVVAACVALLKPFTKQDYLLDHAFKVVQSPAGRRCQELVDLMKPETPWEVLLSIDRMFRKNGDHHEPLQQAIAECIKNTEATALPNKLLDLAINLELCNKFLANPFPKKE